jgi:phenylacetate-CoA ligase
MTEMGLGGGVFCEADYGYHLREADIFFEIIDPITGFRLPDGETGELVFTTLSRTGMPMIRYRTGDESSFLPAPCPCGSKLRALQKIRKRIDQYFLINTHPFQLSEFDEVLFKKIV